MSKLKRLFEDLSFEIVIQDSNGNLTVVKVITSILGEI